MTIAIFRLVLLIATLLPGIICLTESNGTSQQNQVVIIEAHSQHHSNNQQQQNRKQQTKSPSVQYSTGSYINSIHPISSHSIDNKPFTPIIYSSPVYAQHHQSSYGKDSSVIPKIRPSSPVQMDFTPIPLPSGPTPVLMQYLPESQSNGAVQYLQLIPTRPLIVPISPLMSTQFQRSGTVPDYSEKSNLASASTSNSNSIKAGLSGYSIYPSSLPSSSSSVTLGENNLQTYPSSVPPFQFLRPNDGLDLLNSSQDLSLNTDEYMPSPNDAPTLKRVTRGRP